jgi:regulatory protein
VSPDDRRKPPSAPPRGSSDPSEDPKSDAVREAALRLLSVRARSTRELENRLLEKGFQSHQITPCIHWLKEREFLNDEEFAAAYVRDRIRFSPRSPFLLRRELQDRGVHNDLATRVLDSVLEEEGWSVPALATRVACDWVRKQGPAARRALLAPKFTDERERVRRRLYGFLTRRGFVGESVSLGMEAGEQAARDLAGDNG